MLPTYFTMGLSRGRVPPPAASLSPMISLPPSLFPREKVVASWGAVLARAASLLSRLAWEV